MKKMTAPKIVSVIIFVLAILLIVTGLVGFSLRESETAQSLITRMRTYGVMHTAANGIIDDIAKQAKKDARDYADANNYSRNQRTEYAGKQEALARAEAQARYLRFDNVDATETESAIAVLREAMVDVSQTEAAEKQVYAQRYSALYQLVDVASDELNAVITVEYGEAAKASEAAGAEKVTYAYDMAAILQNKLPELNAQYQALNPTDQKVVDKLLKKQADAVLTSLTAAVVAEGEGGASGEEAAASDEIPVDYSQFEQSDLLKAKKKGLEPYYDTLWQALMVQMPDLTNDMQKGMHDPVLATVYEPGETYEMLCTRYSAVKNEKAFSANDRLLLTITDSGDSMIAVGIGLVFLALCIFFYNALIKSLGMPRMVILMFLVLLCVMASLYGINVPGMLGSILKRTGMYGVLALAMLPGIQCGISLNMGMTVGIIGGLMSTMIALEMNMVGWGAFFFSCGLGIVFAIPIGWAYAKLLNRLKGNEMTVSTYVGFSVVSLFCIAWMLLPFHNPKLTWALGMGLRAMHNMGDSFGGILDNLWAFKIGGVNVPTGLLLFLLLCCFLMWLFTRSKTGTAMIAVGSNPRFAEASGINVNRMRTLGTVLSTCIAAVGIIVYSQSFGFMQLYNGPKQMGFVAASAILIGGASVSRGKVSNVILGTFLFQGVLAMGIQVANAAISEGGLSEVMRILISNGIILYALTQSGGGKSGK
ncbi:MAG: hypothetical protein RR696_05050 [Clostridia bacterium]